MIRRSLTGTVEISTAALTVTSRPPAFTGEAGALAVSLSFLNGGTAQDVSSYVAEMYLYYPERRQMTDAVELTVSESTASGVFPEELMVLPGAPLLIVQLSDPGTNGLIVACAQPLQITDTRGELVITTRPPTPSEVIYVGRAPYVDPTTKEWMEWDTDAGEYVSTGYSTDLAAEHAEEAADAIDDMTVSASEVAAGGTPTATITEVSGHKHIAFGIVTGDTGATPDFSIGTVQTLPANADATVTITGTDEEPVLNFGIPQGIQGQTGQTGATGAVPNLSVGTVTTGAAGSAASVTRRSGSPDTAPVFDFSIPRGDTGTGIASVERKYQQGDTATTPPTGTWLDNPPTVAQGKYLWTRFIITETDSPATVTTAYSVAYQGMDGSGSVTTVDSIQAVSGDVPLLTIGSTAPTSATAGSVKSRYFDSVAGVLYICTASSGGSQTWTMAGSSITVDSALSNSSTNPVQNQVITAALANKWTAVDIAIATTDWSQAGQPWPDGGHPLGTDSASTCYVASKSVMSDGTTPIVCADGDDFKVSEYSRTRCPAPLWIYVGTGVIYVATTTQPSQSITIRGLILHQ